MIIDDVTFWNKYKDPLKIKFDRILVDSQIKSDLRKGNFKNLEKAWKRQTLEHLYYVLKGIDIQLGWICLDFGSGVGRIAKELINFCFKIICYDISPSMVRVGREECQGENIEFNHMKDGVISRRSDSIDFLYSLLTIQHFHQENQLEGYLKRFKEIIKPGGIIRFQYCTYDGSSPEEKTNFNGKTYTRPEMEEIIVNIGGLEIIAYDESLGNDNWDWITLTKRIPNEQNIKIP
jgi:ubiquinone/menaquinone biosynthesis C-methylase UbiE